MSSYPRSSLALRLVRAEMLRLRTMRSLWLVAAIGLLEVVLTTLGEVLPRSGGGAALGPSSVQRAMGLPASATIWVAIMGILVVTVEYRHATATGLFLATPRRLVAISVKAVVTLGFAIGYALLLIGVTLAISVPVDASRHEVLISDPASALIITLEVVVVLGLFALIGVGLGAAVRNQVAAVLGFVGWIVGVDGVLAAILADHGLGAVVPYLPSEASFGLTTSLGSLSVGGVHLLAPVPAGLVLLAYVAVLGLIGCLVTVGEDVT